jgi:hypothetical protein
MQPGGAKQGAVLLEVQIMSFCNCLLGMALWHILPGLDPYCIEGQSLLSSI